jgi:NAD(P)-dependent dehydrogenase (short-subunit alcohol dehydrogenase family)
MELKSWGIHVVTLNPATHRTPLVGGLVGTLVKCWQKTDDKIKEQYGEQSLDVAMSLIEQVDSATWDPMNVVHTMEKAVSLHNPSSQYLIGMDALTVMPLSRQLPTWLLELPTAFLPPPKALQLK